MKPRYSKHRIEQALQLLEEAAKDKKDELRSHIGKSYSNIKEIFGGNSHHPLGEATEKVHSVIEESAKQLKQKIENGKAFITDAQKRSQETVSELNKEVHENPFPYLGIVAVTSLVAGFILGRKKGGDYL